MIYDKIFIYCSWISGRWQWSGGLYKNSEEHVYTGEENNTQKMQKHRIHKIENKHTKQEKEHKKNIKKYKSID
jgi:hypothetical protein